jgi:hypothetical protein
MNLTIKTIITLSALFYLSSCGMHTKKDENETNNTSTNKVLANSGEAEKKPMNINFIYVGDSVVIPTFEIEIQLDESAEKKIQSENESIIVQAYFSGIPKDTTIEEYSEWDKLKIGSYRIELYDTRVALFENVKLPRKVLNELQDTNFEILINVFTGRKSSMYNLISCISLQEGIESLKGKRHIIKGKLIPED